MKNVRVTYRLLTKEEQALTSKKDQKQNTPAKSAQQIYPTNKTYQPRRKFPSFMINYAKFKSSVKYHK